MARHITFGLSGVSHYPVAALMAAQPKGLLSARFVPDSTNAKDRHAIAVEMSANGETWALVGWVPRYLKGQPREGTQFNERIGEILGKYRIGGVQVESCGLLKKDRSVGWFRVTLEYFVPTVRESRSLVTAFTTRLLAATDQATVEAIKGEVLAAKDRIRDADLDALRSVYLTQMHRVRREQAA